MGKLIAIVGVFYFYSTQAERDLGVGPAGASTAQMRKIMNVCKNETSKYCTADGGIPAIMQCLEEHLDDLSDICFREYDKVR